MNQHIFKQRERVALKASFSAAVLILAHSTASHAEVKSLTSSELTETYIEDSTIIITPKRDRDLSEQRTISSVTIAPYEGEGEGAELIQETEDSQTGISNAFELSDELLRNTAVDESLIPEIEVDIPSYQELITKPVADILGDERYRPPEGDFDFSYVGDDLGLSRTEDKITFSIGNLPGIEQINIPQAVTDGPVELIPREGGGFDLTIPIPQNQ